MSEEQTANFAASTTPAPPHALEIEKAVLAQILACPDQALVRCMNRLTPDHFVDPKHRLIFTILREVFDRGEAVDLFLVEQRLGDRAKPGDPSCTGYVRALRDASGSSSSLGSNLKILEEKSVLRKTLEACARFIERVSTNQAGAEDALDELECVLYRSVLPGGDFEPQTIEQVMHELTRLTKEGDTSSVARIATGFPAIDRVTGGWPETGVFLLAGDEPELSALAIALAVQTATSSKVAVGFFSLRPTAAILGLRILAAEARVSLSDMFANNLAKEDRERVRFAMQHVARLPIYVDESPTLSIRQLRCHVGELKNRHQISLVVIESLQSITFNPSAGNRTALESLRQVSAEFSVFIIVATGGQRPDSHRHVPHPSDLKETGITGSMKGWVGQLYESRNSVSKAEPPRGAVFLNLLLTHECFGIRKEVPLVFYPQCTRFESMPVPDQA